jgi:hypothetical protein
MNNEHISSDEYFLYVNQGCGIKFPTVLHSEDTIKSCRRYSEQVYGVKFDDDYVVEAHRRTLVGLMNLGKNGQKKPTPVAKYNWFEVCACLICESIPPRSSPYSHYEWMEESSQFRLIRRRIDNEPEYDNGVAARNRTFILDILRSVSSGRVLRLSRNTPTENHWPLSEHRLYVECVDCAARCDSPEEREELGTVYTAHDERVSSRVYYWQMNQ